MTPDPAQLDALAALVRDARRPMLWLGGSARDAAAAATTLVERGVGAQLMVGDLATAMPTLYTERPGFIISDKYPGHGAFLRCKPCGDHHNLFVLNRPGRPGAASRGSGL